MRLEDDSLSHGWLRNFGSPAVLKIAPQIPTIKYKAPTRISNAVLRAFYLFPLYSHSLGMANFHALNFTDVLSS
jgi:hypothetical protein